MTDIELIKSKIDIVEFIGEYITIKKAGRNFKALCPFHSEKTPSFHISSERQSWYCFGSCAEGGDVIAFLQKWENLEFVEALKILAQRAGVQLTGYAPTDELKKKEKIYAVNNIASSFFHYLLISHNLGKKALEYLKERKIEDRIIKTFSIGYAPLSWDSLGKYLTKKGYSYKEMEMAGLVVRTERDRYYDRFRGRLVFTLRDHRGNVVGFSARKLPFHEKDDSPGGKYINTPETTVYIKGNVLYGLDITKEKIKEKKEVIIVEGEFDMLASFQSGVSNVVAIKGSALTEGQVMLLRRYTENLILSLDCDFAGNEAALRGIEIADNAGLNVKVVRLQKGKDPAECISFGVGFWKESIEKSIGIYDFIIENAINKYGKIEASGKRKITDSVVPILSRLNNYVVKSHYIKKLAKELDVSEESVEMSVDNFRKKKTPQTSQVIPVKSNRNRREMLEEHLISLLIQSDRSFEMTTKAKDNLDPGYFKTQPTKVIIKLLFDYFQKNKEFNSNIFVKALEPQFQELFNKLYIIDIEETLSSTQTYEREFYETITELKKDELRRKINEISTKIKEAEEKDNNEDVIINQTLLQNYLLQIKEIDKKGMKI